MPRLPPPWKQNPAIAQRQAKLSRLKRKGLLPPPGKATARRILAEHNGMDHWRAEIEREVRAQHEAEQIRKMFHRDD